METSERIKRQAQAALELENADFFHSRELWSKIISMMILL
jgi:hypothetical protein